MLLKYNLKQNFCFSKVRLLLGEKVVECRIPYSPIFCQVKQIILKVNQLNEKCLQLLQKGYVQIAAQKSKQFVTRCRDVFGFDVKLNTVELAINNMIICTNNNTKILDYLEFSDLLQVIKESFAKTIQQLHFKIIRKLKNYLKVSQRQSSQKKMIEDLVKIYKECEKIQDDEKIEENQNKRRQSNQIIENSTKAKEKSQKTINNEEEVKVRYKPKKNVKFNKQQTAQPRRGRTGRFGSVSNEKQDQKIYLGINGDTEEGWRRRNRPIRVPSTVQLQTNCKDSNISSPKYKQQKKKGTKKQQQKKSTQQSSVSSLTWKNNPRKKSINEQQVAQIVYNITIIDEKEMKQIFTLKNDKQKFNFNRLKSDFVLLINENIWVKYYDKTLSIMKNNNGYIRKTKIDLLKHGLMAEGLTISLDGNSNIQDGGDIVGNPTIQQFTGSTSQFFNVTKMKVYVPK